MLFDRLCRIAERHVPKLRSLCEAARIFDFPHRAHETLAATMTPEEKKFLFEQFFLPFDCVAIEDTATCVLFGDSHADQTSLKDDRVWCEIIGSDIRRIGEFEDGAEHAEEAKEQADKYGDFYVVNLGIVRGEWDKDAAFQIGLTGSWAVNFDTEETQDFTKKAQSDPKAMQAISRNIATAIREIAFVNSPSRFVIEQQRTDLIGKMAKGPKIMRSVDRPIYRFADVTEIRKFIPLPADVEPSVGQHISPRPHERRKHFRTLKADCFVNAKGRKLTIPATWIGPSEAVVGKHRYRVMLDL
jgi:hypothetical protein